jgi:serine/threonine protein kinase
MRKTSEIADTQEAELLDQPCPHCTEQHPSGYSHCPRTGRPLQTGQALVGRVIAGRYRVTSIIGEGGMGTVYLADHLGLGRQVAIKRLHSEMTGDAKAVARFQREARAAAATGHEHIVEVMDLGYAEDGAPYLVMEYLRGASLAQVLKHDGRLTVARTINIVSQVLAALVAVHAKEIVHRDLKPDNIFLLRKATNPDFVKILDFGISKMKQEEGEPNDLTRTGVTMGTPYYMSPEQARGIRKLDHRVDLYGVAVILYECLTGKLPFFGDNYHALLQQILRCEPLPPRELVSSIPAELESVVLKGLSRDPMARFSSAAEMLAALTPLKSTGTPEVIRNTPPGPPLSTPTYVSAPVRIVPQVTAPRVVEVGPRYFFAASEDYTEDTRKRSPARTSAVSLTMRDRFVERPASAERESFDGPRTDPARVDPELRTKEPDGRVRESGMSLPYEGPGVKGAVVVGLLEHYGQTIPSTTLAGLADVVPDSVRPLLQGVVLPMAWVPTSAFQSVLEARDALLARVDPSAAANAGRTFAERELATTLRSFLQTATPASILDRIPTLHRTYFSRGEARASRQGSDIHLDFSGEGLDGVHVANWLSGFWQRMLQLSGMRDVRISSLQHRTRREDRVLIVLRAR